MSLGDGAMTAPVSFDVAREHDRFLADSEVASWQDRGGGNVPAELFVDAG